MCDERVTKYKQVTHAMSMGAKLPDGHNLLKGSKAGKMWVNSVKGIGGKEKGDSTYINNGGPLGRINI